MVEKEERVSVWLKRRERECVVEKEERECVVEVCG